MVRALVLLVALIAVPEVAGAQIYKYVRPDGSVIYTDKLSDLSPERRAYYADLERQRRLERERLEREIGKEELARREAEQKRAALAEKRLADAEHQRQLVELQALVDAYKRRAAEREAQKSVWQTKMRAAREKLAELLKKFAETRERYESLAIRPMHTLLPGQAEERDAAKKALEELEVQVDAAIVEVEVSIPEAARKAGVPPGWLREP